MLMWMTFYVYHVNDVFPMIPKSQKDSISELLIPHNLSKSYNRGLPCLLFTIRVHESYFN